MNDLFNSYLIKQQELCVKEKIDVPIFKGAMHNATQVLNANSESNNQVIFSTPTPSPTTILSRHVKIESEIVLKGTIRLNTLNNDIDYLAQSVVGCGSNTAFLVATAGSIPTTILKNNTQGPTAYPFQSMCDNVTVGLNDKNFSIPLRDVMSSLLTINDNSTETNRYNSQCPSMRDVYAKMTDCAYANNNPYSSFSDNSLLQSQNSNSSYEILIYYEVPGGFNLVRSDTYFETNTDYNIYYVIRTYEPILLSPFIYADQANTSGIYNLQSLSMRFDLGREDRVLRTSWSTYTGLTPPINTFGWKEQPNGLQFQLVPNEGYGIFKGISNSRLNLNYLSPFPSTLLPKTCVLPFMSVDRYITLINNSRIEAHANNLITYQTTTLNSINLSSIPEKLSLCIRPRQQYLKNNITNYNMIISNISVNWNNTSGLLSSCNVYDLHQMSVKAGSNLAFCEFSGRTTADNNDNNNPHISIPTVGSTLLLNFGDHITMSNESYAPGSMCVAQLVITVTYGYQVSDVELPENYLEAVLTTYTSGILTIDDGNTNVYFGVLSKQEVLDKVAEDYYFDENDNKRNLIGGSFFGTMRNSIGNIYNKMKPYMDILMPAVKKQLRAKDNEGNEYMQKGANVLEALGYGQSGGMCACDVKKRIQ
jgi:hypothetical protein